MIDGNDFYDKLTKWLENYFKDQKDINTYRGLEDSTEFNKDVEEAKKRGMEFYIDPLLPTDFVAVKTEPGKGFYYYLFWLIGSLDPNLERRLQFYQFYLTRISELNRVEIIIVIPKKRYVKLREKLNKIAVVNKFGLWEVDLSQSELRVIFTPKTFRDRMIEEFKNPKDEKILKELPEKVRAKPEATAKFFDTYVREAVEAMVGITPEQFGKRYIERKILDLAFDLKSVSYHKKLCELVTQHLLKKGNDYDFVSRAFSELWKECKLKMEYSNFLKEYEPALYHISAGEKKVYRDHYLHQFQVFLLGIHIIDKYHKIIEKCHKNFTLDILEKQWLVAASFHDMAYPVQLYDSWSKKFFKNIFGISNVGASDLKSEFIDKTLLSCMGYLINSFCETHLKKILGGKFLAEEQKLVQFFYAKITGVKHHCILSGLSLLKQASKVNDSGLLENVMIPAALAITLHDKEIWDTLCNEHGCSMIKFENDPLAFILLFCDCIQEWGRPKASPEERKIEERFLLKEIEATKDKYSVTIFAPYLLSTSPFFDKTERDVKELEKFLAQPDGLKFEIKLKDKSGTERAYDMKGKSQTPPAERVA